MLYLKKSRNRMQSRAAANCPPCSCVSTIPMLDYPVQPWGGLSKANNLWTCKEILGEVLNTKHFDASTYQTEYVAYGKAEPGVWITVGLLLEAKVGFYKGKAMLEDMFVTQADEYGDWHFTMYDVFYQGLAYADRVIRARNPIDNYGIANTIYNDYYDPDIKKIMPGSDEFNELVDFSFDEAYKWITHWTIDTTISNDICPLAAELLAWVVGNLFGEIVESGWNLKNGGHSDLTICLLVKEYGSDPRDKTPAHNFIGSSSLIKRGKTCITARFTLPSYGVARGNVNGESVGSAFREIINAIIGLGNAR